MAGPKALVFDAKHGQWLSFAGPEKIFSSHLLSEVLPVLRQVEDAAEDDEDTWMIGWVSYEASPAFDSALRARAGSDIPLIWFGQFKHPTYLDQLPTPSQQVQHCWYSSMGARDYADSFAAVHQHIARGDTYQANMSFRLRAYEVSDAYSLFHSMVSQQAGRYSIFIDAGRFAICSASPELFYEMSGREVVCRPMKGTAKRVGDESLQTAKIRELLCSEKERAENVMIVDMVRNDLSRVAEDGSVQVINLFQVEQYPGIFQMVSEVRATTNASFTDVFATLFPCASITGAPKARTMEILEQYENTPRGLYTGSLAVMAPGKRAWCNVAIRTAVIDRNVGVAEYGVGSGVVWDSESEGEYRECLLKSQVVDQRVEFPDLLETLRLDRETGYWLRDCHVERLAQSAAQLGYPCDLATVSRALESVAESNASSNATLRVRLLVNSSGGIRTEVHDLSTLPQPYRVALATNCIRSDDLRLVHKTTDRGVYDSAMPNVPGADDVLLWNERGEVTESRIATVLVLRDGVMYTPPLSSGVLPGCLRRWLLEKGEVVERAVSIEDLRAAQGIFLANSLRGIWQVELLG